MIPKIFLENSVFSTPDFLKCLEQEYGTFEVDAWFISYVIKRKFGFSKLQFTTKLVNLFGQVAPSDVEERIIPLILKKAEGLSVDYVAQPMAHVFFYSVPDGAIGIKWSSPVVDLRFENDVILERMHKKHRNVVKRAEKENILVDFDASVEDVYEVIFGTMERQGRPSVSLNTLVKIKQSVSRIMFVACYIDSRIQGVAVIPYDSRKAYYLYGGSADSVVTGALNYMQFQIMLKLKLIGIEEYDLMGYRLDGVTDEKIDGIQRFKLRFGSDLVEGVTWKYIIRPYKYKMQIAIYKLKGFFSRTSYRGDVIDQGQYEK